MNKADHFSEAEIVLGTESREQAEVGPTAWLRCSPNSSNGVRFSIGLHLCVESAGSVSDTLGGLRERCPGFLEYAAVYAKEHPGEPRHQFMYSAASSIDRICDADEKALRAR